MIDDIADSFDYKNKYAIVEYLKELADDSLFSLIILSHNFDFFRTVAGRLGLERGNRLLTHKINGEIQLQEEKYQKSAPFGYWRKHLNEDSMLIASIPFLRNLAEFSGDDLSFQTLTSLLHLKKDTPGITILDLENLIKGILKDSNSLSLASPTLPVYDLIHKVANDISIDPKEVPGLEDKVVLSIAVRLKAEEFMIGKINDSAFVESITSNQTIELIKRFKNDFPNEREDIIVLDQVNLMTPENIHLNSFMYEPILDLSAHHLKKLYRKVLALK